MSYPPGITLRTVTIGGATTLESGEQLSLAAEIKSSRSLMWGATGWQFHAVTRTIKGNDGEELTFSLPVTDLTGWRLLDNPGAAIDVSTPGSYTHTYTIKLSTLQGGRTVAVRTVGPFVLPAENLSPIDLDLILPVGTQAGGVVLVPDTWGALIEAGTDPATIAALVEDYLTANPPAGGGTAHYGADADTPRPVSSQPVIWVGRSGVTPANAAEFDIIIQYEGTPPAASPPTEAPTLAVATASASQIDGTISPLIDATGYEWVHETGAVSGSPTATAADNGASLTFSAGGLDAAAEYTFWARGYNEDGPGPWSDPRTATTTGTLLEFVEDFDIAPPSMHLHEDPRWASLISTPVFVYNDDPDFGNYANVTRGADLIAAQVDPVTVPFPPDQWAEADVAHLRELNDAKAIVYSRATGRYDHYYGELEHDGDWKLVSVVAGVETILESGSMARPAYPYTQRLEVKGSQIMLLINGTEIATVTNSDHTSGQPGLGFYRGGGACTEFRAGELP